MDSERNCTPKQLLFRVGGVELATSSVYFDSEILTERVTDATFFQYGLKCFDLVWFRSLKNDFTGAGIVANEIDVIEIGGVGVGLD